MRGKDDTNSTFYSFFLITCSSCKHQYFDGALTICSQYSGAITLPAYSADEVRSCFVFSIIQIRWTKSMPSQRLGYFLQGMIESSVTYKANVWETVDVIKHRKDTNLVVDKYFISFTATCNIFTVYCKTNKVFLICVASESTDLYTSFEVYILIF